MKRMILSLTAWAARLFPSALKQKMYRLGGFTHALRWLLNRAAPHGLSEVVIAAGSLKGMRMQLDLQSEKDYWLGTYESPLQRTIADWIQEGWIVYDVGANVGYVSLMLARRVGKEGKVFAFEALPANGTRLITNLRLNQLQDQVEVVCAAVTEQSGKCFFQIGISDDTGRVLGSANQKAASQAGIEVDGLSLDDFIFQQSHPIPQGIKIDIEGGEVLALPGMRRLLQQTHPLLLLEIHSHKAAEDCGQLLAEFGYELKRMDKTYSKIESLGEIGKRGYIIAH